ncbi:MAG: DNA photolyase family protein [Anaerolineae bacterium]|nr:DNA photolyase family protein [Anaerolineae bacterium]
MAFNIWWIRRDLRLYDNPALMTAFKANEGYVIPLFILDPSLQISWESRRFVFLIKALHHLNADLRSRGSRLIMRQGNPLSVLTRLVHDLPINAIFAEADYSPYAIKRDNEIKKTLPLQTVGGVSLRDPDLVLKADGQPYTVFTPYSRAWRSLPLELAAPVAAPVQMRSVPQEIDSLDLPNAFELPYYLPTESEGQMRLESFINTKIENYALRRDRMDLEATSNLSPYLRFGLVSAQQAVRAVISYCAGLPDEDRQAGAYSWLNELIWREFYNAILFHFPTVLKEAFRPGLRQINWRVDTAGLQAWQSGQTGYPVVDAAMRQLQETGWMHNRARMITASFLVKDLLINWQEGEHWFMRQLLDGDPAANNGGWQWTAGVGTDAAPYFRVFNPVLQGQKFDPVGVYVRRWVPELAAVPDKYIHQPWLMPVLLQRDLHCRIGVDYPDRLVEHDRARERTLAAYQESLRASDTQHKIV